MKKILIPTDFSQNAGSALSYAIEIANQFGSKLVLCFCYQVPRKADTLLSLEPYIVRNAGEELEKIAKDTRSACTPAVEVSTKVVRGHPVDLIGDMADKNAFDLIIMGTKGATGLQGVLYGSTTVGIIKRTQTPVLAIPFGLSYQPVRKIVLAIDGAPVSSREVLCPAIELARVWNAEILLYHLREKEEEKVHPGFDRFLQDVPHTYHYEIGQSDLLARLDRFVAASGAGMLCTIHRERSFLENIFHASVTKRQVFRTDIPLLALHDESTEKYLEMTAFAKSP